MNRWTAWMVALAMIWVGCGSPSETTSSTGSGGTSATTSTTAATGASSGGSGTTTTITDVPCAAEDDGDPCTNDEATVEAGLCVQHHGQNTGADCAAGACFVGKCVAMTCSDPLLAYEPKGLIYDPSPFGPLSDRVSGMAAGRGARFSVRTTCHAAIVGLSIYPGFCEIPAAVALAVWSEETGEATQTPASSMVELASGELLPVSDAKNQIFKLPIGGEDGVTFQAGSFPFVGFVLGPKTCSTASTNSCDPGRAWWYRPVAPAQGWAPLLKPEKGSPAPASKDQLLFGFADCAPAP